jgi:Mrp family chromosome partitioning ATPase
VNTPVLRELPVKVGVSPASVVIESDAEFDPEAETQFGNPAYARPRPSTAAVRGRGRVVAVWGPAGAPGRTTVAIGVADEAARLGVTTLLADADPYGGTVAPTVGLPDEIAGLALASRDAVAGRLGTVQLAQRSRQLRRGCGCSPDTAAPTGGGSCPRPDCRSCSTSPAGCAR